MALQPDPRQGRERRMRQEFQSSRFVRAGTKKSGIARAMRDDPELSRCAALVGGKSLFGIEARLQILLLG